MYLTFDINSLFDKSKVPTIVLVGPVKHFDYIVNKNEAKNVNAHAKGNIKNTKTRDYVANKDDSQKASGSRPVQIKKVPSYRTNGIINFEHQGKIAKVIENGRARKEVLRYFSTSSSFDEANDEAKAVNLKELVQEYEQAEAKRDAAIAERDWYKDMAWFGHIIEQKEAEQAHEEYVKSIDPRLKVSLCLHELEEWNREAKAYLCGKTKHYIKKHKVKKSSLEKQLDKLQLDELYENTGNMRLVINSFNQRNR